MRSAESRGERNIEFVSLFNILDQTIPEDIGTLVLIYKQIGMSVYNVRKISSHFLLYFGFALVS